jgi:hypothetical protein
MCSVSTGRLLSKAGTECREEFLYELKAGLRAASGRPPARQRLDCHHGAFLLPLELAPPASRFLALVPLTV